MVLETAGRAGMTYDLALWNPNMVESVQGATVVKDTAEVTKLRIHFEAKAGEKYAHQQVVMQLHPPKIPRGRPLKQ
jgi:hypothetical protein